MAAFNHINRLLRKDHPRMILHVTLHRTLPTAGHQINQGIKNENWHFGSYLSEFSNDLENVHDSTTYLRMDCGKIELEN